MQDKNNDIQRPQQQQHATTTMTETSTTALPAATKHKRRGQFDVIGGTPAENVDVKAHDVADLGRVGGQAGRQRSGLIRVCSRSTTTEAAMGTWFYVRHKWDGNAVVRLIYNGT